MIVLLEVLAGLNNVAPLRDSLEEAEVGQDDGGSSRDAGRAVDENLQLLVVDHVI